MSLDESTTALRPITPGDHEPALAINERHVELHAPLDRPRLLELFETSARADLILSGLDKLDQQVAGFVLTFAAGHGVRLGELPAGSPDGTTTSSISTGSRSTLRTSAAAWPRACTTSSRPPLWPAAGVVLEVNAD